jgi:phage-related protein (TIGR01555 family)
MRGLGGGAIFMWIDGDDPETPLDPKRVKLNGIKNLFVRHYSRITLGEIVFDMADEWFSQPQFYQLSDYNLVRGGAQGALKFHPSRVIAFKGEEVPDLGAATWQQRFWGASKVEIALNAVLNSDAAQNSFAGLIKDAVNVIIGIPDLTGMMASKESEAILTARTNAVSFGKSMWRAIFYDSGNSDGKGGEKIDFRQTTWTGIPDTMMAFIYPVAAAGNMPATVLLGKSPDGMNATGDGDLEVWRDEINGRRDLDLRPCIDQLDLALVPSALGKTDGTIWWNYPALKTPSAKETAETGYLKAQTIEKYVNLSILPTIAVEKGVQNMLIEDGLMPGFDDALSELPEDERFPSLSMPEPGEDPTIDPTTGLPVDPNAGPQGDPAPVA